MTENHFGSDVARTYDADHQGNAADLNPMIDRLVMLAAGGPVLEFAIGTGRVALPLIAQGITVKGIELSGAMVAELRAKPHGDTIEVVQGDMSVAQVPGTFQLVYLVFNTIDNLTTQAAQVACFRNAARHLKPGGAFLVETQVPPLQDLPFGETKRAFACAEGHWGIDEIDVATQTLTSHHIWRDADSMRELSVPFRYVWPSELDLMADMAGLTFESRHADWTGAPFDRFARRHISVWRAPQA